MNTPATTQPKKAFFTPVLIDDKNAPLAYFHDLGPADRAHLLAKVYSDPAALAAAIEKTTHVLSRWGNIDGEIWSTEDPQPLKPTAIYTRIK